MSKKQKIVAIVIGVLTFICIIGILPKDDNSQNINETTQTTENRNTENKDLGENTDVQVEEENQLETENKNESELKKELTEEEYKNLCVEVYNDDIFKSNIDVGEYVKIHVMASSKYKYSSSDMQGIIVRDITDTYNLEMNCLGCTVMHESTKDSTIPSYFGKQMYIMFVKESEITLDKFKTGEKYIIYGEVIQNVNGTFVLPKYYEEE